MAHSGEKTYLLEFDVLFLKNPHGKRSDNKRCWWNVPRFLGGFQVPPRLGDLRVFLLRPKTWQLFSHIFWRFWVEILQKSWISSFLGRVFEKTTGWDDHPIILFRFSALKFLPASATNRLWRSAVEPKKNDESSTIGILNRKLAVRFFFWEIYICAVKLPVTSFLVGEIHPFFFLGMTLWGLYPHRNHSWFQWR